MIPRSVLILVISIITYLYINQEKNEKKEAIMSASKTHRTILKHFIPTFRSEGVGAKVRRSIGVPEMQKFSPFVMLDHFQVKAPAGFEQHPHHGQETITLLLDNYMAHEDFTGLLMPFGNKFKNGLMPRLRSWVFKTLTSQCLFHLRS